MARIAKRIFGTLIACFMGLMALGAAFSDVDHSDAPTASLADVARGKLPIESTARLEDGWVVWSRAVAYGEKDLPTGRFELEGYYVPVVRADQVEALLTDDAPLHDVRVVVHIHRETAESEFAGLSGAEEIPAASPVALSGTLQRGQTMDYAAKSELDRYLPGLDLDRVVILDHNPPDERVFYVVGALVLGLLAAGWAFSGGTPRDESLDDVDTEDHVVLRRRERDHTQPRRLESVGNRQAQL